MSWLVGLVVGRLNDERGQGLTEYVLILVLVAILLMFMLTTIGQNLNNTLSTVNSSMP